MIADTTLNHGSKKAQKDITERTITGKDRTVDDKTLQPKLNQFVKIGNELTEEARRRYGREGNLFHEAEGGVYIMEGDSDGNAGERQKHIRHSANHNATWGSGAW